MAKREVKVAAIQSKAFYGTKDELVDNSLALLDQAGRDGALICCLGELFSMEYDRFLQREFEHYKPMHTIAESIPGPTTDKAVEIAKKVEAINDTLPELHLLWSNIYLFQGNAEKAINAGKKAIALGPNNALSHILLAYAMNFVGRFEEAIDLAEKSMAQRVVGT